MSKLRKKKRVIVTILIATAVSVALALPLYNISPPSGIAEDQKEREERTKGYELGEAPGRYEFGCPVYIGNKGREYEYLELSEIGAPREVALYNKSEIASEVAIEFTLLDNTVDYRTFTGDEIYYMLTERKGERLTNVQYAQNNVILANEYKMKTSVANIEVLGCTLFDEGGEAVVYIGCDFIYDEINISIDELMKEDSYVDKNATKYLKTYYKLQWSEEKGTYLIDNFIHYRGLEETATNNV